MNSGSIGRRERRNHVDIMTASKKYGTPHCRKNKTGGRRYSIQLVLPKKITKIVSDFFKRRKENIAQLYSLIEIKKMLLNVKPVKVIVHDEFKSL